MSFKVEFNRLKKYDSTIPKGTCSSYATIVFFSLALTFVARCLNTNEKLLNHNSYVEACIFSHFMSVDMSQRSKNYVIA